MVERLVRFTLLGKKNPPGGNYARGSGFLMNRSPYRALWENVPVQGAGFDFVYLGLRRAKSESPGRFVWLLAGRNFPKPGVIHKGRQTVNLWFRI